MSWASEIRQFVSRIRTLVDRDRHRCANVLVNKFPIEEGAQQTIRIDGTDHSVILEKINSFGDIDARYSRNDQDLSIFMTRHSEGSIISIVKQDINLIVLPHTEKPIHVLIEPHDLADLDNLSFSILCLSWKPL